jgi:hypothetical protein
MGEPIDINPNDPDFPGNLFKTLRWIRMAYAQQTGTSGRSPCVFEKASFDL